MRGSIVVNMFGHAYNSATRAVKHITIKGE